MSSKTLVVGVLIALVVIALGVAASHHAQAEAGVMACGGGCGDQPTQTTPAAPPPSTVPASTPAPLSADEAKCPVTGEIQKKADMIAYDYQGTTYYFCCPACVPKFKADPSKYLQPSPAPAAPAQPSSTTAPSQTDQAPAPSQTEQGYYYTCPMHPKVRQDQPGSCPKCGMTLVKQAKEQA